MSTPASATERLRTAITGGAFQPGERLIESELMEQFGSPRRVIRDALAELDKEGLVARTANRGASVRKISLDEAIEITQVRSLLEGLIASQAATMATAAERDDLAAIVERMQVASRSNPLVDFPPLYREFHQRLRAIGRHGTAAELVDVLRNRNAQFQFRTALMPGRVDQSLAEHEAIAAAIVAGDADGARAAMQTHLEAVVDALRLWNQTDSVF